MIDEVDEKLIEKKKRIESRSKDKRKGEGEKGTRKERREKITKISYRGGSEIEKQREKEKKGKKTQ